MLDPGALFVWFGRSGFRFIGEGVRICDIVHIERDVFRVFNFARPL